VAIVLPFVFLWRSHDIIVIVRCGACRRADVRIRWPEAWALCERCGVAALWRDRPVRVAR
jgi:hypothetical protein